ncbi:hypothetical protein [Foetidibacter luteolus]|uniref:hypothetical protein n=1 Tax=Foetidibacter luteolus TaxID=2608880 RepID=UPI00129BC86D|nr:hypothetical protein [Foetidibacter luteolus]
MKICLFLLLAGLSLNAFAQKHNNIYLYPLPSPPAKNKQFSAQTDSMRAYKRKMQELYRTYYPDTAYKKNEMPNAFTARQRRYLTPVYRYNNGKGLDVYESPLDNMPVVKPDSTFYSPMPAGRYKIIVQQPNRGGNK